MAENKKSVLLYCDIIHTVEELNDEEAGKLFKHYLRYINDLNPISPDKLTQIVFEPIKQNLKRDLKKWELIVEKRSIAGLASAEKRKQNATNSTHVESVEEKSTNPTVTDTVNVTVIDKDILYKGNFFYIGTELYKFPVSKYVSIELPIKLSDFDKNHKDIKLQAVLDKMDNDYKGYAFSNHNHILKSFDYTAEKLKPKKQYNQPEKITVTSNPKPFPRENR